MYYTRTLIHRSSHSSPITGTTAIIVAVCVGVAAAMGIFVFFRVVWRFCQRTRKPAVPLPPVQPLAHHRERQVSQFYQRSAGSRPATWYDASYNAQRTFYTSGSDASLFPLQDGVPSPNDGYGETPEASPGPESPLALPNPAFRNASGSPSPSTSSVEISDESRDVHREDSTSSIPQRYVSHSSDSPSASPNDLPRPRPRSASGVRVSRARPVSMASVASSHSRTSMIRGTPHGPHSTLQIVLPAPLAVQPDFNYGQHPSVNRSEKGDSSNRLSVVDGWASIAVQSSSLDGTPAAQWKRRSVSTPAEDRTSMSPISNSRNYPPLYPPSRRSSRHPSSSSFTGFPPPVPRIPTVYSISGASSSNASLETPDRERGRPTGASSSLSGRPHQMPEAPAVLS